MTDEARSALNETLAGEARHLAAFLRAYLDNIAPRDEGGCAALTTQAEKAVRGAIGRIQAADREAHARAELAADLATHRTIVAERRAAEGRQTR